MNALGIICLIVAGVLALEFAIRLFRIVFIETGDYSILCRPFGKVGGIGGAFLTIIEVVVAFFLLLIAFMF